METPAHIGSHCIGLTFDETQYRSMLQIIQGTKYRTVHEFLYGLVDGFIMLKTQPDLYKFKSEE